MILLPHFDIPSGFWLGKFPQEFPFYGPVFFESVYKISYIYVLIILLTSYVRSMAQLVKCLPSNAIVTGSKHFDRITFFQIFMHLYAN